MSGSDKEPDRQVPTNGWGEWRYYVLEKLKDQQETIERLNKDNADLQLHMQIMREKKLEQRHEDLKRRVAVLKETADDLSITVKDFKNEKRDKLKSEKALKAAIIQGFIALIISIGGIFLKQCSSQKDTDVKKPSASSPSEN